MAKKPPTMSAPRGSIAHCEKQYVSLREYVDQRFADQEKAAALAFKSVESATRKGESSSHTLVAWVAIVISVITLAVVVVRGHA